MAIKGSASRGPYKEQSTPMRHSRFIPEAERGWKYDADGERERHGSSSSGTMDSNNGNSNRPRRSSSFLSFASLWQSPRGKLRQVAADDEVEDRREIEEEDEDEEEERMIRGHGRERSNSMPTSPVSDDNRSYFTAGEDLERPFSGTSSMKRKSLQMPPNLELLTFEDGEGSRTPTRPLSRQTETHSRSNSTLAPKASVSLEHASRGYAWRREADATSGKGGSTGGAYIHPSHRNPTGKQAFYDTHFGSSSGWRSVAGMADDVFHPFEQAKSTLGRWSGLKKEKKGKEEDVEPSKTFLDRKKESLLGWNALNSLGVFGISSSGPSDSKQQQFQQSDEKHQTFEAELIPTIHRDPHANRYFKNLQGNVVVLGGYRGSILRDAETHQMMWVPLKVGVGLRRPTLELALTNKAEDDSEDLVIADEMLGGIGSMVDMGKRLIQRCSTKRTKVHSWGYDWRLSLGRSSKRLEAYLQDLWMKSAEREQDRRGAKVIAHSMGGLVALHALARTKRPEIFESLVFASTPFLGTANILGPFRFGDAALFNDEICSPRATFSFRSSFYLLPVDPSDSEGEGSKMDTRGGRCFEEEDGVPHDLDFLDAETWNDLGISPCVEIGKRKEVLEKSRKRAIKEGYSLNERLERSASIRDAQGIRVVDDDDEQAKAATSTVPSMPGTDIHLTSSSQSEDEKKGTPGNQSNSSAMLESAGQGLYEAAKTGQSILSEVESESSEDNLQPLNLQDKSRFIRRQNSTLSDSEWQEIMEDEASAAWLYLENTLAETRKFFQELRTSFKEEYAKQGRYPPIAILTSGRTPTVRGALVAHTSEPLQQNPDQWKEGARKGDYSRMLYAPGDGVILRRSSTTLPGRWSELLVRGDENDKNALTNHEGVVETSHRHVTLLSDVDGIGRCLEACRRANSLRTVVH